MKRVTIRVPATTANLGPGFDCMGIALKLYSEADFEKIDSGFQIFITNYKGKEKVFLPSFYSWIFIAAERSANDCSRIS